jgi:hypothetical protein
MDDVKWDGIDRRANPHPYELFQHMDARFIQIREDLARIVSRQDDHERKLRGIDDSIQQAAGMARMLRWVIVLSGASWAGAVWLKEHFNW